MVAIPILSLGLLGDDSKSLTCLPGMSQICRSWVGDQGLGGWAAVSQTEKGGLA